jgi:hypothetical protein
MCRTSWRRRTASTPADRGNARRGCRANAGIPRQLLQMDRAFCHDTLDHGVLRLHQALGPYVLLAEYIWMSRVLPLVGRRRS